MSFVRRTNGASKGTLRHQQMLPPTAGPAQIEDLELRRLLSVGGGYTNAGLTGQYFGNTTWTGPAAFTRNDVRVDFDWGTALKPGGSTSPNYASVGTDNASARWTGQVIARFSETYTFKGEADDYLVIRMRPTGGAWTTVVNQTTAGTGTGTFAMTAGVAYDIEVSHRETTGSAKARVLWSSPSTPEEVIESFSISGYMVDGRATFMFADAARSARPGWEAIDGNPAPAQDASGWPTANGALVVWEGTQDNFHAGTYNVRFTGKADISIWPNGLSEITLRRMGDPTVYQWGFSASQIYNPANNTSEFQLVVGGNGAFNSPFVLTVRNSDRDGVGTDNDGITNLQIMRPRTVGGADPHPYGTIFSDAFKAAADVFTHYRFLDTNGNLTEAEWADRTKPGYYSAARGGPAGMARKGWTYEYEIMFANETGKDLYITVPMRASNDYFLKLARLLRYGSDQNGNPYTAPQADPAHPGLNPNLKVYVELSNEVWNWAGGFEQTRQADDDAFAAMTAPVGTPLRAEGNIITYDGGVNTEDLQGFWSLDMNRLRRWHALRSLRMSEQFRSVFDSQMNDRARMLVEFWYNNTLGANYSSLHFLDDYFNNGDGLSHVATPHPLSYFFWGAGGASYFGSGNSTGTLAVDPIVNPSFDNNASLPLNQTSVRPTIPGWTFAGNSGVYGKATSTPRPVYTSEGLTLADLSDPQTGDYAAYIKRSSTTGTISTNITFTKAGRYAIGFRCWQPQGQSRPPLDFFLDGVRVTPQYRPYTGVGDPDPAAGPAAISYSWNSDFNQGFDEYSTATVYIDVPAGGSRSVSFSVSIPAIDVAPGHWDYSNQVAQYLAFDKFYVASVDRIFEGGMPSTGEAQGQQGSDDWVRDRNQIAQQAQAYGLNVMSYESGWSLGGDNGAMPIQNWAKYRDPRARAVNAEAIDIHVRAGYDGIAWGVYEQWRDWDLANAANSELRKSFVDRINILPAEPTNGVTTAVPLTAGNQTMAQVVNRDGWETNWVRNADATLGANEWIMWNVLVPTTGTYIITANTAAGGQARLSANEQTTIASGASGGALSGTAFLTRGLHTIKLKATSGSFSFTQVTVVAQNAPAAPVLNSATDGDASATLNWSAVTGATSYVIRYGTAPGSYNQELAVGNVTTGTVTGLTNNQAYYFVVCAVNANGQSAASNVRGVIPLAEGQLGNLAVWEFAGNTGSEVTSTPSSSSRTVVSVISRGPGLSPSTADWAGGMRVNRFASEPSSSAGHTYGADLAGAIAKNQYYQFTIAPAAGKRLSLEMLSFRTFYQNGNGGSGITYSIDGANFSAGIPATAWAAPWPFVDLGDIAELQSTTATVTIRIYLYGLGAYEVSALGDNSGSDVVVNGSFESIPAASVASRLAFYNRSYFDGNDPAASAADDAAIATDKTALLPGQTASFTNYTSYSRGLNGLMLDIAAGPGTLAADDFAFRVGNTLDPATWATGPAPLSVTRRAGAGTGGSDRYTLIFADNAIAKQWLQITVLANADTGLAAPDVFYFGNAVGESGNSAANAMVNSTDELGARNNPHGLSNRAAVTDAYDYNRDSLVNSTDQLIARNNGTGISTALRLITAPGGAAPAAPGGKSKLLVRSEPSSLFATVSIGGKKGVVEDTDDPLAVLLA